MTVASYRLIIHICFAKKVRDVGAKRAVTSNRKIASQWSSYDKEIAFHLHFLAAFHVLLFSIQFNPWHLPLVTHYETIKVKQNRKCSFTTADCRLL